MAFESMNLLPATSPDAIFSASYCNTPEDIILLWRAARPPPLVIRVPNLRNNIVFGGSLLGGNLQNASGAKPGKSSFPFLTLAPSESPSRLKYKTTTGACGRQGKAVSRAAVCQVRGRVDEGTDSSCACLGQVWGGFASWMSTTPMKSPVRDHRSLTPSQVCASHCWRDQKVA